MRRRSRLAACWGCVTQAERIQSISRCCTTAGKPLTIEPLNVNPAKAEILFAASEATGD